MADRSSAAAEPSPVGLESLARSALFRNSAVYVLGQVAQRALAFLLVFLYTRLLTPADYGLLGTLNAYSGFLLPVLLLGLPGAAGKQFFDFPEPRALGSYVYSLVVAQALYALVVVGALSLAGPLLWPIAAGNTIPFFPYVPLALAVTLFLSLGQIPLALFQAQSRPWTVVLVQVAQTLVGAAASLAFILGWSLGATGLLLGTALAGLLGALALGYLLTRSLAPRRAQVAHVRSGLRFGLPLLPHALASILMVTIDRPLLQRWAPLSEVGIYSIAVTLGQVLAMLAAGVNQAWVPRYFQLMKDPAPMAAVRHTFTVFTAGMVALCVFGSLCAHELVCVVLPPGYLPAARFVAPLLLGHLFGALYYFPANTLFFHERTRALPLISTVAAAVAVALDMALIPRWGAAAAAWGFAAASLMQSALTFVVARRVDPRFHIGPGPALLAATAVAMVVAHWLFPLGLALRLTLVAGCVLLSWTVARRRTRAEPA